MVCELPAANSRIPGPAAYFEAPGLLTFASEDSEGLRAVLRDLLRPVHRAERGAGNRRYVAAHLSLDRHVNGVLEVFRSELDLLPRSMS
jgi:hypothetical protein